MKPWFRMDAVADDPSTVDLYIVDIIGGWIDAWFEEGGGPGVLTAKAFLAQLASLPAAVKTIRLHVNSPGGDVFAAVNIANALRDQRLSKNRTVEVFIEGLAASSASIVIMAGSTIRIADNALVMIHNPWSLAVGTAAEMRKAAEELDTVRATIVSTYRWHSELNDEELVALMDATTWMDADDALLYGFATEKVEGLKAAASLDPRALAAAKLAVPEHFRARVEALLERPEKARLEPPAPAADLLRLCREAEVFDLAEELVASGATLEQATARVRRERETRAAAAERRMEIQTLCATARLPELADGYAQGAMPLEAIRAQLTLLTAKLDAIEIDGSLLPDRGAHGTVRIDVDAVYAARNCLKKE